MSAPPLAGSHGASAPQATDGLLDLGRVFRAVLRYKWGVLGLALAITLLTALFVFTREPVYSARASLVLETNQANVVAIEEIYSTGTSRYDYFLTQYEILKSRNLAERVVRRLGLHKTDLVSPAAEDQPLIDMTALKPSHEQQPPLQLTEAEREAAAISRATGMVTGGLSVSPVQYSHLVYLVYESTDPELAAKVVNTLAEEFIARDLEGRTSGTKEATTWLTERLMELKDTLGESEEALQQFRVDEQLVDVEGVTGLGGQELKALSSRLEEARRQRIEAENVLEGVSGSRQSTEELLNIPAVLQHELIRGLKTDQSRAQRRVAELGKRYGVKHPKMIAARSDLDSATQALKGGVEKVVGGINREYELALRNEKELQARWDERKLEVQDFNRKEFQLLELQREVDTNRQLYEIFLTRARETNSAGAFERPHARILDAALVPTRPIRPNKRFSLMVAFFLGLIAGCAAAVLLDIVDDTLRSPDEVMEKLAVPVLGATPSVDTDAEGMIEQYWQNPHSQYAEALRTIRTGVILSKLDVPAKVIIVTSSVEGEGKSTIALNLGAALGQMERTLVIGADLRRPSLAKRCDLSPNHRGLSHFVSGVAQLEDCIEFLEDQQMHVMPAGVIPPNPLEMISSRKFIEALDQLKARFDRIVIDSAPVHAVSDPLVLASYADSVIYVIKADSTSATLARKGIDRIVASNEPLTGVVLNQFDARRMSRYYGGKGYYYGNYQTASDPADS